MCVQGMEWSPDGSGMCSSTQHGNMQIDSGRKQKTDQLNRRSRRLLQQAEKASMAIRPQTFKNIDVVNDNFENNNLKGLN